MKTLPLLRIPTTATRRAFGLQLLLLVLCWPLPVRSATFLLPTDGSTVVGQLQVVTVDSRNTLLDIARHFDLGYEEIAAANPGISIWLPGEGTQIVVPTEFILPPQPWEGIVVNIPQRRLYYFPPRKAKAPAMVETYPIGIARPGWPTPLGKTRIIAKYKDPSWFVPKTIQEEHRREGEPNFPDYFPPGPTNPMGMLAIETGFSGIYLHGTNRPWGVGLRVSHGCIHLYPEHAAFLYPRLPVGTPVRVIDRPVMVGERDGLLYLSVSEPVGEYPGDQDNLLPRAMDSLSLYGDPAAIDWRRVQAAVDAKRILPIPVSAGAPTLDDLIAATTPEPYDFEPYGIEANDAMPPDLPH